MERISHFFQIGRTALNLLIAGSLAFSPASSWAEERFVHTVEAGETLSTILTRYGITGLYGRQGAVAKVASLNRPAISDADTIRPGQKLVINFLNRKVAGEEESLSSSAAVPDLVPAIGPTPFRPYSWVELGGGASYLAFEGRQLSNGTRAKLISNLSPTVALLWKQQWSEKTNSYLGLSLKTLSIQPEKSGTAIEGGKLTESTLRVGVNTKVARAIEFGLGGGIQNAIFYRGTSAGGLEMFQTPIFTLRPNMSLDLLKIEPFTLHARGGLSYFGESSYGGTAIRSGYGYDGSIGLEQLFSKSSLGCDLTYATRKQDTQYLALTQKEVGLFCALQWRLQ